MIDLEHPKVNMYEEIEKELHLDDIECMENILVSIRCDDLIHNVIIGPNEDFNWAWDYDWWEGEEDVEFLGAIALSDIRIEGNQLKYRKKDI